MRKVRECEGGGGVKYFCFGNYEKDLYRKNKISCVIVGEYVSMNNLVDIYNKTPEHLRVKLLSDLKYPLSSGKERRIGDVISGRIYNFVYGIK